MFQLMHVSPKIGTAPDSQPLRLNPQNADICFDNVHFGYLPGRIIPSHTSLLIGVGNQTTSSKCI